jgi:formate hydrogenlyase subunit 3/multisubunit Na+/H+ antiporter MnhD subunit
VLAWVVFGAGRAASAAPAAVVSAWQGRIGLRVDALSSFTLLAIAGFGLLVPLYSLSFMRGRDGLRTYDASLLCTLGLACGAVLANDLFLLLVFWGLLGVTLYLMIGVGGSAAAAAAKKTFIVVGGSDCLLMLGVGILWFVAGTTRMDEVRVELSGGLRWVAFLCFAVAAFAKAGAMPFHSWVPDCGEKAPVPVTAFLPASLDKLLGIYLLARVCLGLFGLTPGARLLLMFVGAGTVVCAVMMALVQHDLKRLLAYHAVSQVGYMVLGIGSGTAIGIAGGLFHMLNNTIYKSCLFLCAGSVEAQAGTSDLDKLGGLARRMPLTFACCLTASLAIAGVPPLNGFFSKWMIYQGLIEWGRDAGGAWVLWLAAAMLGSALTLASFVKVLHAVFLCKPADSVAGREARDPAACMWVPTALLALLCVLFGVFAFRLPLATAIRPAVGAPLAFLGDWRSGEAALLLGAAYVAGLVVYLLGTARRPRECETYIGGEIMDEVRGPDAAGGVEVTGVDFYRTIEDLAVLRGVYRAAKNRAFDLYDVGSKAVFYGVELLRGAHTGNLLLYVTWFLVGLVVVLGCLLGGGRLP